MAIPTVLGDLRVNHIIMGIDISVVCALMPIVIRAGHIPTMWSSAVIKANEENASFRQVFPARSLGIKDAILGVPGSPSDDGSVYCHTRYVLSTLETTSNSLTISDSTSL